MRVSVRWDGGDVTCTPEDVPGLVREHGHVEVVPLGHTGRVMRIAAKRPGVWCVDPACDQHTEAVGVLPHRHDPEPAA